MPHKFEQRFETRLFFFQILRKSAKNLKNNFFEIWPSLNTFNRDIMLVNSLEILCPITFQYTSKHVSVLVGEKKTQKTLKNKIILNLAPSGLPEHHL